MFKKYEHLAVRWGFQTAGAKVQHSRDLFAGQVEPFNYAFNAGASLEILENRRDRHSRATEDPRPANFSGYAFDSRAL